MFVALTIKFPRYAFGVSWRFDVVRNRPIMQVRDLIAQVFDYKLEKVIVSA